MDNTLMATIVIVYFAALMLLGSRASRRIKSSKDYILAGKSIGFWMFVILMVSSTTSGMTLLGSSGLGFNTGWPTIWEQIFVPLTVAVCIVLYGAKLSQVGKARAGYSYSEYS